eukprot:11339885-Karenia_brevis.AAC.1
MEAAPLALSSHLSHLGKRKHKQATSAEHKQPKVVRRNEDKADHNDDETDLAHVEPTSLRTSIDMEMETDEARSIEKTTSAQSRQKGAHT